MTIACAILVSNALILAVAILVGELQERARRRLRPADRARVAEFVASRSDRC